MHFVLFLLTIVQIQIIGVVYRMLNAQQARPTQSHYFNPSFSVRPQPYFFNALLNFFLIGYYVLRLSKTCEGGA